MPRRIKSAKKSRIVDDDVDVDMEYSVENDFHSDSDDEFGAPQLSGVTKDALDDYIDANRHRIVKDEDTGKEIVLTDHELGLLERIQSGKYAAPILDPYADYEDWFDFEDGIHPLSAAPEPKRRFIPSKWEAQKVLRIVKAIRRGAYIPKTKEEKEEEEREKDYEQDKKPFYLLWETDIQHDEPNFMHLAAPKLPLPKHEESYNPPIEYIPSEEERKEWEETDPDLRGSNFLPQKHTALRHVGAYDRIIHERFERCLDLYLCPRARKKRMRVDPESLLPQLPSPADLRPFPQSLIMAFKGHKAAVHAVSFDSTGQFLATGDEAGQVRIWEVDTGRCFMVHNLSKTKGDCINCLAWRPQSSADEINQNVPILAVAGGEEVTLINAALEGVTATVKSVRDILVVGKQTKKMVVEEKEKEKEESGSSSAPTTGGVDESVCKWSVSKGTGDSEGDERAKVVLSLQGRVTKVAWHAKGDYFITVSRGAESRAVLIHRLSQHVTQNPFSKHHGQVQAAVFHPTQPVVFVATRQHIRLYHLTKHSMIRKLTPGVSVISSIDVHHSGDHLIVGSFDKRVLWFDLDFSSKPFRVLRYHTSGVRNVTYHRKYPLFASCADDGTTHVFHGRVYSDFTQNPLIVPLKVLQGHTVVKSYGVLSCAFHPHQPWVATAGADSEVYLWA